MYRTMFKQAILMLSLLTSCVLLAQSFSAPRVFGPFVDSFQLVTGDFNRDGAADLAGVANFNGASQTAVVVYMNNGSGGFGTAQTLAGTTGAVTVQVGDFNQDGNLDIAFMSGTQAEVGVLLGNGKGGFAAPAFYAVNGIPDSIAVGDFNTDGKTDIAVLSNITKKVTILSSTGSSFTTSSFAVPSYFADSNSGYQPDVALTLLTGDFNGDGRADLAFLDSCGDAACGPGLSRIYTLTNTGSGFTAELLPNSIGGSVSIYAADLDLDGRTDFIEVVTGNDYELVSVEYSNGNNTYTEVIVNNDNLSADYPRSVVVGDFNNDGIEDIAGYTDSLQISGTADYGFDIYTGKGGRSGFNAPVHVADPLTNVSLRGGFAAGFFNQDGSKDIVAVDSNGLLEFLNTTSTAKDPCPYGAGVGLRACLPASGGTGTSPVHFLASYKASAQPASRIELWVDAKKEFQVFSDLLSTSLALSPGAHQISFVGVDATGRYVKQNESFTVSATANCSAPASPGVRFCSPASGATLSSPISVAASASPAKGVNVTAVRLYVDNVAEYTANGNVVNTTLPLATGQHYLVVVAYETNGSAETASSTITVH